MFGTRFFSNSPKNIKKNQRFLIKKYEMTLLGIEKKLPHIARKHA